MTHGIGFLPQVDRIIVLKDGKISESGTFAELLKYDGAFADFLRNYLNEEIDEDKEDEEDEDGRLISFLFVLYF